MTNLRIIKIYNIKPHFFKATCIQVKEINTGIFICRFLDPIVINEFKTIGFKVNYLNSNEHFTLSGELSLEYATSIWKAYLEIKDNPYIKLELEDLHD